MWSTTEQQSYNFVDSLKVYRALSCETQICIYSINFKALFKQITSVYYMKKMQNEGKS